MQKTGIDLQKDVYTVVGAIYGTLDSDNPEAVGIVNLKYDPAKLLAVLKENQVISAEEKYGDLHHLHPEERGRGQAKDMRLAFLNKSNIAIGSPLQVKQAIDLSLKKGNSVLKTAAMMKYVDKLDKNVMFWLAVGNIPEKMKSAPAGGMMPVDLSKAEAFTAFVDYKNKTFSGELRLISQNEAGNKQIADMLNGLKSLGAMGASKEPELGQLLNSILLSSAADHVKLTFSLSEELMNKLGAKAKDKAKAMAAPPRRPARGNAACGDAAPVRPPDACREAGMPAWRCSAVNWLVASARAFPGAAGRPFLPGRPGKRAAAFSDRPPRSCCCCSCSPLVIALSHQPVAEEIVPLAAPDVHPLAAVLVPAAGPGHQDPGLFRFRFPGAATSREFVIPNCSRT